MNCHTDTYKRIRANIIKTWPAWKKKIYNSCLAVSAHAEKLPEEDRTTSTPVWTKYDRIMQMPPDELAKELFHFCPYEEDGCRHLTDNTPCVACRLAWLKSPVEGQQMKEQNETTNFELYFKHPFAAAIFLCELLAKGADTVTGKHFLYGGRAAYEWVDWLDSPVEDEKDERH